MVNMGGFSIYAEAEWYSLLAAQNVEREHVAYKCPECAAIQSPYDAIKIRQELSISDAEKYVEYSCIGTLYGMLPYQENEPKGKGCNFSFNDTRKLRKIQLRYDDESMAPKFEIAKPEEAQVHRKMNLELANGLDVTSIDDPENLDGDVETRMSKFKQLISDFDVNNLDMTSEDLANPPHTEYQFEYDIKHKTDLIEDVKDGTQPEPPTDEVIHQVNEESVTEVVDDVIPLAETVSFEDKYEIPTLKKFLNTNYQHQDYGLRVTKRAARK